MFRSQNILGLLVALALASTASATPTLSISPVTFTGGGTAGFFDIAVTNPSGTEHIASYTATFTITPRTGATGGFTFSGNFATQAPNPTFAGQDPFEAMSGSVVGANDSDFNNPPFATGGDGTNLYRANFTVNAGTTGAFDIVFNTAPSGTPTGLQTRLGSDQGAVIVVNTMNGTVSVPEPTSLGFAALAGLALLRRRRTAAAA